MKLLTYKIEDYRPGRYPSPVVEKRLVAYLWGIRLFVRKKISLVNKAGRSLSDAEVKELLAKHNKARK